MKRWPLPVWLFLFFFALYAFLSAGNLGLDSHVRYRTASSILQGNGFQVWGEGTLTFVGEDGEERSYSRYTHGQTLLFLPLELFLVRPLLLAVPEVLRSRAAELIVALTFFPFFGALSMVLLFLVLQQFDINNRSASLFTLIVGLATPLLCYNAHPQEPSQLLALLLGGLLVTIRAIRTNSLAVLYLGIHLICFATHLRPQNAIDCAALTLFCWWLDRRWFSSSGRRSPFPTVHFLAAFASAGILSIVAFALFNYARFGNPFLTGYNLFFEVHGVDPYSGSFLRGIWMPLVSKDYGYIWFCPLLLALLGVRPSRLPGELLMLFRIGVVVFALLLIMHAKYVSFTGGFGYAPRFQLHLLPLLLLPLLPLLRPPRLPVWLLLLVVLSGTQQLAWKALSPLLEAPFLLQEDRLFPEMADLAQPGRQVQRWINLSAKLHGTLRDSLREAAGEELSPLQASLVEWDFFWTRGSRFGGAIAWGLKGLAGLLFFLAALAFRQVSRLGKVL